MKKLLVIPILASVAWAQEQPTGMVEVGYRATPALNGDLNTYRSVVNLGEGPRLLRAEFTLPSGKFYDTFTFRANNWGGDPYNSARLTVEKFGVYRATVVYRNTTYFNALPSFANVTGAFNQRSFDQKQRFFDADVDLRPGKGFSPFFGVSRQGARGTAVSPLVFDENNYPAASTVNFGYTTARVGLRWTREKYHFTFEQSVARFHDDQTLSVDTRSNGNRPGTYLGQQLFLLNGKDSYGVSGSTNTTGIHGTVSPASWIDLSGQFFYTRPNTTANFTESAAGLFILLDTFRFTNGIQSAASSEAVQPRTTGNVAVELRPWSRLRLVDSVSTDRIHNQATLPVIWNYNENRFEAFFDVTKWLTIRAGERSTWGESFTPRSRLDKLEWSEQGRIQRTAFIGGIVLRPIKALTINADTEQATGDHAWFRTTLTDFNSLKLRARYQLNQNWSMTGHFIRLNGSNPTWAGNYAFSNATGGASVQWQQAKSGRLSVLAEYVRGTLYSDILYRDPASFGSLRSLYRDNLHSATLLTDFKVHSRFAVSVGGTLLRTGGTRPTSYYQPQGRITMPLRANCEFFAEWRYYDFGQVIFSREQFHTHQIMIALRIKTAPATKK